MIPLQLSSGVSQRPRTCVRLRIFHVPRLGAEGRPAQWVRFPRIMMGAGALFGFESRAAFLARAECFALQLPNPAG